jgi:serine/threonine protein kinase
MTDPASMADLIKEGNPLEMFSLHQCLGEGTYGSVWKGKRKGDDKTSGWLAIKIMKVGRELEQIKLEAKLLASCNNEFVVEYHGTYLSNGGEYAWIVMEVCMCLCTVHSEAINQ